MPDFRDTQHTALPADTKALLSIREVENFSLLLNRCVHFLPQKPDQFDGRTKPLVERARRESLKAHLFIKDKLNVFAGWSEGNKRAFGAYGRRYREVIHNLCAPAGTRSFCMQTAWRLAIGLGGGSVYENGISLHHIYGVPYLPASSVKGVALRAYKELPDQNETEEQTLFGTDEKMGRVVFFDAFPENLTNDMVSPDIINNHYQDYYEGKAPPADWHSPNPIFFLTLRQVSFQFYLGILDAKDMVLLTRAEAALQRALINNGIGAKTAVGYGLFQTAIQNG